MNKLFTAIVAFASIIMANAQATIYVATDGNDSADGSKESPISSVQKALDMVEPGGTIYLRQGTYYPECRLLPPRNLRQLTNVSH